MIVFMFHMFHFPIFKDFFDKFSWFEGPPVISNIDRYSFMIVPYVAAIVITYLIADIGVGIANGLCFTGMILLGNHLYTEYKDVDHFGLTQFQFFLCLQAFCWITQFIGHGLFEKRAPAILSNILFIYLAPFFEMFLVMNKLFGYKESA